jgi:hypothetical protein
MAFFAGYSQSLMLLPRHLYSRRRQLRDISISDMINQAIGAICAGHVVPAKSTKTVLKIMPAVKTKAQAAAG